jgi:pilus assembly protein CpaE
VCAIALDLETRTTLADAARERHRLDERLLRELSPRHHSGLRVLAAPHDALDAADVNDEALARVIATAQRAFDFVVVDTPPLVDGTMLTVLDVAHRIFLVNQGTVPDVIGAARLLHTLDQLHIAPERRSIVLNRNLPGFAGSLTAAEVGDRLGRDVDHEIPHDKRVLTGLNLGEPLVLRARSRFGWGRAIRGMIEDVAELRAGGAAEIPDPADEKEPRAAWRTADADA